MHTYQKEQLEYIQDQINKIRNLAEERQSQLAWQTVNKVRTLKAILKTASQEEGLQN